MPQWYQLILIHSTVNVLNVLLFFSVFLGYTFSIVGICFSIKSFPLSWVSLSCHTFHQVLHPLQGFVFSYLHRSLSSSQYLYRRYTESLFSLTVFCFHSSSSQFSSTFLQEFQSKTFEIHTHLTIFSINADQSKNHNVFHMFHM